MSYLREKSSTVPRQTKYSRKKRRLALENVQNTGVFNILNTLNTHLIESANSNFPVEYDVNEDNTNVIREEEILTITSADEDIDVTDNVFDFSNADTNKEELCAAALCFYFSGKMTKAHFQLEWSFSI